VPRRADVQSPILQLREGCPLSEPAETLRSLSYEIPSASEFESIMTSLGRMDDRSTILVLSAFLDNLLEAAIRWKLKRLGTSKFDKLFRNSGSPLSSTSAKIMMANAMNILGDEPCAQLDRIRTIRNAFAHSSMLIDFTSPPVLKECEKLRPDNLISGATLSPVTPREKIIVTCQFIGMIIMTQISHYGTQRYYGTFGPVFWRAPSPDKLSSQHLHTSQSQD
jgi:hypothetical protein